MKRMAAAGGLMLLLAGCYPAQQAFDQNSTTYNGQTAAVTPQPATQPTWQHYDGTPVWPPSATGQTASANIPLFNNSPLSPYSAGAKAPLGTSVLPAPAVATATAAAATPAPAPTNVASAAPNASPFQQIPAAVRGASPQASSGDLVAQADWNTRDALPVPKATAKSGPAHSANEPPLLVPLPESKPLVKETRVEPSAGPAPDMVRQVSWETPHTSAKTTSGHSTPAVRMVNNKRIQLNYRVEDTGPSGVGSVDLWCTTDGRNWQKSECVSQVGSSCVTEVHEEGIYGFTLVARSGNGNAKEPPKAGDLPQVWVEVDLTAPVVALTEVKPSTVHGASHLNICWNASDRNMARRPITLCYSPHQAGPWTTIAANVENIGRYDWSVPTALPPKIYIKIEACDFVGNVGFAQTREAIALDTAKPSVSILDVEPAGSK